MEPTLKFKCPSCGRQFAPLPFMREAITINKRTCQGCGEVWQVKGEPRKIKGGWVHFADFVFLGRRAGQAERDRERYRKEGLL